MNSPILESTTEPTVVTIAPEALERETSYGHSLWCWGCPQCWRPEIAEQEAMREGAI